MTSTTLAAISFSCLRTLALRPLRRCLLSLALLTDRLNMLGWISSLTAQSRIWMCLLLLPSLAIRPWSQQSAPDQDTWPRELRRANSTDTNTSNSSLSYSRPQADLDHTPMEFTLQTAVHVVKPRGYTVTTADTLSSSPPHLYLCLCSFGWLQHSLTHSSHSRA